MNEAQDEIRAGEADDEIVARLSQLRTSRHGPNIHVHCQNEI